MKLCPNVISKLILEACHEAKVVLQSKVLTSSVEIINCHSTTFLLDVGLEFLTIQIDGSSKIDIGLLQGEKIPNLTIFSSKESSEITITNLDNKGGVMKSYKIDKDEQKKALETLKDEQERQSVFQFRSRVLRSSDYSINVITEAVIREGNGLPSTQIERKKAEEKQEQLLEKLEKFLTKNNGSIQSTEFCKK